jgi:quercetin 2,3-dioxygenase
MIRRRAAQERGKTRFDWLESWHTFSFGEYYDPEQLGFRTLRVINDDIVAPGTGFGTHPHRDMEIITWVIDGALQHRDSMGTGSVIRPGEVQRMSAGTGILHSEHNPSPGAATRLLQIWILPERTGLKPEYEQKAFPPSELQGRLRLVVDREGRDGALSVHQDVRLYVGRFAAGDSVPHTLGAGRHGWVQVAVGGVEVNGVALEEGDGAAISDETQLDIRSPEGAEILLFELA